MCVQLYCGFEIFPNKSWVKNGVLTMTSCWVYSGKGQETGVIWMPIFSGFFLKQHCHIVFHPKNFLIPAQQFYRSSKNVCFHIPGKYFLVSKHPSPKPKRQQKTPHKYPLSLWEKDMSFWWLKESEDLLPRTKQDLSSLVSPKILPECGSYQKGSPLSNQKPHQPNRRTYS